MSLEKLKELLTLERLTPNPEDVLRHLLDGSEVTRPADPNLKGKDSADHVTRAVAGQAAARLLHPESEVRRRIKMEWCVKLWSDRNKDKDQMPWNNGLDEAGPVGAAFATGRVWEDIGTHLDEHLDKPAAEDVRDQALRTLDRWLIVWLRQLRNWDTFLELPFVYRAARALRTHDALSQEAEELVGRYAQSILCRMIARHTLGSLAQFDATLCCLALMAQHDFSPDPLRELERRNCLAHIFRLGGPLVTACRTTITRLGPVAIGCSGVEVLLRLLRNPSFQNDMEKHEEQLVAALSWLEGKCEMVDGAHEYKCDLYPDRNDAWFNAIVLQFLKELREFVVRKDQELLRKTYKAYYPTMEHEGSVAYADLTSGGYRWPEILKSKFLAQVKADKATRKHNNGIILFGPPGTGKSTIAKAVAMAVGEEWQYVKLSPADFLENGQSKLFKTLRSIFQDLKRFHRCVVFFDEMELLVLARAEKDSHKPDWITELVTNAMLPELQELHDCPNVIPILATNSIPRFDKAGRRPGRFDYILPVGFPSPEECAVLIGKKLKSDAHRVRGLEEIPKYATISQILRWLRQYNDGEPGLDAANKIWAEEFKRVCDLNRDDQDALDKDAILYAYPTGVAEKTPRGKLV